MGGYGASEDKYRFNWTYPIVISPHDPNVLYIGGNLVFKSSNEGQSWQPISPDLTRADPETLKPTGGPVNLDAIGAETYATVFAFAESPHEPGVLWAGSDDGLLHISKNGGQSWNKITPPDMPEWSMISCIELSPHDKATAYVAATRYKLDDYRPYVYKTSDYGRTWQAITNGIPEHDFTRVIRADLARPGLLYAGTETGLYLSFDDGSSWQRFQLNLPIAPIHDLLIKNNDLIAGTHGRSIWVLDDLTPLHQVSDATGATHLFKPRATVRIGDGVDWSNDTPGKSYLGAIGGGLIISKTPENATVRKYLDVGQNPPKGAIITYRLSEKPSGTISLTFSDSQGKVIREFTSLEPPPAEAPEKPKDKDDPKAKELKISANAGWNRFIWDLRYAPATRISGKDPASEMIIAGPLVAPGSYKVTLTVGEQRFTESFDVIKPADVTATQADLQAQFDLLIAIHRKVDATIQSVNRMRDLRGQLDGWSARAEGLPGGKSIAAAAKALKEQVLEIEKAILLPDVRLGWIGSYNQGVRLLEQLVELPSAISLGDYRPTDQAQEAFADLAGKINDQLEHLDQLTQTDLPALNRLIANAGVGAIALTRGHAADEAEGAPDIVSGTLSREGAGEGGTPPDAG